MPPSFSATTRCRSPQLGAIEASATQSITVVSTQTASWVGMPLLAIGVECQVAYTCSSRVSPELASATPSESSEAAATSSLALASLSMSCLAPAMRCSTELPHDASTARLAAAVNVATRPAAGVVTGSISANGSNQQKGYHQGQPEAVAGVHISMPSTATSSDAMTDPAPHPECANSSSRDLSGAEARARYAEVVTASTACQANHVGTPTDSSGNASSPAARNTSQGATPSRITDAATPTGDRCARRCHTTTVSSSSAAPA